ncbi:MAG: hypothetical protein M1826_005397 [Phylliscum demangeonii]|nr:MAG: hypothetical protein M1826_005397 [Phylliscum demangeonii]
MASLGAMYNTLPNLDEGEIGLDFRQSLARSGMAWLPDLLFDWDELSFRRDVLDQVSFTHNGLRDKFRNWRAQEGGERMWSVEDGLRLRLAALAARADVDPAEQPAWDDETLKIIMTMHQLVGCGYQRHVWSLLTPHLTVARKLRRVVLDGISGLSCPIVERVLQHAPLLSMPRGGTFRSTNFRRFENTWVAHLQLLFDWDDGFRRAWDGLAYHHQARRFHTIIEHAIGPEHAAAFRPNFGQSLKIHPHYSEQRRAELEAASMSMRWQRLAARHPDAPDPGDVDTATPESTIEIGTTAPFFLLRISESTSSSPPVTQPVDQLSPLLLNTSADYSTDFKQ